jgi:hypothetical protein
MQQMNRLTVIREPADRTGVWAAPEGRSIRPRLRYVLLVPVLLVPTTLTATLGTLHFTEADATAIASFWPAAALQVVFSIWYGVYGMLAGMIAPMLGNALVGDTPLLFLPANALQSLLPGLWFRWRRLDPRLRRWRDWVELIVVCCIGAHALGAAAGVAESIHGTPGDHPPGFWQGKYLGWLLGNTLPALVLVPAMLKTGSDMVIRSPMFCQGFFGGANQRPSAPRLTLSDVPMMGKLMILVFVAGILPVSLVAGWVVWSNIHKTHEDAGKLNLEAVIDPRRDLERFMLRMRECVRHVRQSPPSRQAGALAAWELDQSQFADMRIVSRSDLLAMIPRETKVAIDELPVLFFLAETVLPEMGWRLVSVAPTRSSAALVRSNVANPAAALVNLAIFGSLIAGAGIARRISRRVLEIVERVEDDQAQPGSLALPDDGRDELGILAGALNKYSRDLAHNVQRLRETRVEKQRLETELDLARQVQRTILPKQPPELAGYELGVTSVPAGEVGGDFFDQ